MDLSEMDGKLIVALLGWATTVVIFVVKTRMDRKIPQKIVCRELSNTSLVRINKEALDRIDVRFDQKTVNRIAFIEFEIFNIGNETITSPSLRFEFPTNTKILEIMPKPIPDQLQSYKMEVDIEKNIAEVKLPYLNARKDHNQKIELSFVCDGNKGVVEVLGGGEGWSIDYQSILDRLKKLRYRDKILQVIAWTTSILPMCLTSYHLSNIKSNQWDYETLRVVGAFVLNLSFVCALVWTFMFFSFRYICKEAQIRKFEWHDHGEGYEAWKLRQSKKRKKSTPRSLPPTESPEGENKAD